MQITLPEAAALAGVPQQQLLVWATLGAGPKCSGNPYRPRSMSYERGELDAWLQEATKDQPRG